MIPGLVRRWPGKRVWPDGFRIGDTHGVTSCKAGRGQALSLRIVACQQIFPYTRIHGGGAAFRHYGRRGQEVFGAGVEFCLGDVTLGDEISRDEFRRFIASSLHPEDRSRNIFHNEGYANMSCRPR